MFENPQTGKPWVRRIGELRKVRHSERSELADERDTYFARALRKMIYDVYFEWIERAVKAADRVGRQIGISAGAIWIPKQGLARVIWPKFGPGDRNPLIRWWAVLGSNQWPRACEARALPLS